MWSRVCCISLAINGQNRHFSLNEWILICAALPHWVLTAGLWRRNVDVCRSDAWYTSALTRKETEKWNDLNTSVTRACGCVFVVRAKPQRLCALCVSWAEKWLNQRHARFPLSLCSCYTCFNHLKTRYILYFGIYSVTVSSHLSPHV